MISSSSSIFFCCGKKMLKLKVSKIHVRIIERYYLKSKNHSSYRRIKWLSVESVLAYGSLYRSSQTLLNGLQR